MTKRFTAAAMVMLLTAIASSASAETKKTATAEKASYAPGESFSDCGDCPGMIVIPPGSFDMGSTKEERSRENVPEAFGEREQPVHAVTLGKAFALSRTEITRGQYAKFSAETKRPVLANCAIYDREHDNWAKSTGSWQDPGFQQGDDEPTVCLSWNDATAFAAWLSKKTGKRYRLPTEAEWEYSARAGTKSARYWGDSPRTLCESANVMSSATFTDIGSPESWQDKLICAGRDAWTMKAGTFEPNPFGLYDMYGGVWEWAADCAHGDYVGAPTDGSAWVDAECPRRLVRGGAFHSEFWLARSATRGAGLNPDAHPVASGFRLARDL